MGKIRKINKNTKTINVYKLPDNFRVEPETAESVTDFYLCHNAYGDKMHMFGIPNCTAEAEMEFTIANVEEYIDIFNEQFI